VRAVHAQNKRRGLAFAQRRVKLYRRRVNSAFGIGVGNVF